MNSETIHKTQNATIDRILSTEQPLLPSSGFAASVMDSVRAEAAAPRPVPFPWRIALPGYLFATAVLLRAGWVLRNAFHTLIASDYLDQVALTPFKLPAQVIPFGWAAIALILTALGWALSLRLARRSRLL